MPVLLNLRFFARRDDFSPSVGRTIGFRRLPWCLRRSRAVPQPGLLHPVQDLQLSVRSFIDGIFGHEGLDRGYRRGNHGTVANRMRGQLLFRLVLQPIAFQESEAERRAVGLDAHQQVDRKRKRILAFGHEVEQSGIADSKEPGIELELLAFLDIGDEVAVAGRTDGVGSLGALVGPDARQVPVEYSLLGGGERIQGNQGGATAGG